MIQLDLSILNQNGTPMFNSNIFANRPAFGIVGRIFISTDTSQIFRDTGTSYVLIASVGSAGTITGSGTTGTLPLWSGSTSLGDSLITQSASVLTAAAKTFVTNTNTAISLLNPLGLSVGTNNTFDASITWPALEPCDNVEFLQNNSYNGNITYGNGSYTANHLILSSFQFLVAATTITSTQTTGIRALANQILQARINGTNNGTITHFANSLVYGDFAASTARFNFTNRYGYLVNNLDEYGAGHTYTNRYAFYNQGANDHNHFAGKMLLNTLTVTSDQLSVVGTSNFNGNITGTNYNFSGNGTVGGNLAVTGTTTVTGSTRINGFLTLNVAASVYGFHNATTVISATTAGFLGNSTVGIGVINFRNYWSQPNITVSSAVLNVFHYFATQGNYNSVVPVNQIGFLAADTLISATNNFGFSGQISVGTNRFNLHMVGTAANFLNGTTLIGTLVDNGAKFQVFGTSTFSNSIYNGTSTINASAQLQVDSITKGFLPPRMTTAEKNAIVTPPAGLIVYDTTLNKLCVRTAAAFETITSV